MVIEIKTVEQFEQEINSEKCVLDFNATWCGPCNMFAPIFEKVSEEFPNIKFLSIDVNVNEEIAARYNIRNIPTMIALQNKEIKNQVMGYLNDNSFRNFLEKSF